MAVSSEDGLSTSAQAAVNCCSIWSDQPMAETKLNKRHLKQAIKEAMVEALQEQRDLLHEVFAEVLEDFALAEAIREGQRTKLISGDEVRRIPQSTP